MDGNGKMESFPIRTAAALPAWFPSVIGGSAWWLPASIHQRVAASDRRRSRRRVPAGNAIALLRSASAGLPRIDGMNMGAIGMAVLKANPAKLGRIKNISMTGLAFNYVDSMVCSGRPCRLDILLAEKGFYLKNIAYSVISDSRCIDDRSCDDIPVGQLSVCFHNLNPRQRRQLRQFITAFTQGIS